MMEDDGNASPAGEEFHSRHLHSRSVRLLAASPAEVGKRFDSFDDFPPCCPHYYCHFLVLLLKLSEGNGFDIECHILMSLRA